MQLQQKFLHYCHSIHKVWNVIEGDPVMYVLCAQWSFLQHIEADKKWPPIFWRHFQMHSLMALCKFRLIFHRSLFPMFKLAIFQYLFSIWQAIIWTNDR